MASFLIVDRPPRLSPTLTHTYIHTHQHSYSLLCLLLAYAIIALRWCYDKLPRAKELSALQDPSVAQEISDFWFLSLLRTLAVHFLTQIGAFE